ncbi:unnamed protein product [Paramecium primaurelia]|nr:unnamed protein product [Paramecium primaurelia]
MEIRLWEIKREQEMNSCDKIYNNMFINIRTALQQITPYSEVSNYITTVLISQKSIFQSKGALILNGEFINQSGIDLKTLFQKKGSYFLESLSKNLI